MRRLELSRNIKLDKISANTTEYWTGMGWTVKVIMRKLFKTEAAANAEYQAQVQSGKMSHLARVCIIR